VKLALDPQMFYATTSVTDLPDIVASLGYEWMELSPKADFIPFFRYPRADSASVALLRKKAADAGIGIASVIPVLRWSGPDEDERQAAVRAWNRAIQITVDLGVEVMNSEFNGRLEDPEYAESQFLRSMDELAPVFEREGIALVLEPHPDDFIEDGHAAVDMVRGLDKAWISFLYCTPHTFHQGNDATGIITHAAALLSYVHIADTLDHTANNGLRYIVNPPGCSVRVHQHAEIGQGEVDFDEVFRSLSDIGLNGVISSCVFGWDERARARQRRPARQDPGADEQALRYRAPGEGRHVKLGAYTAYTACLHDRPLPEALRILSGMGLDGAEINTGGFLPAVHMPVADIRSSDTAVEDYLGLFATAGMTLTAFNCNGNPLHPDREVREKHAADVREAIALGSRLGVKRVVTMSGLPGSHAGTRLPAWNVLPWDSAYLDSLDYQWQEVALPFWRQINAVAADADVKVCLEMHPHNLVYNPATMERLATEINATHIGAEMDPSHLFWQGIDPVAALQRLGALVYNAAAKDTRINSAAAVNGVLDDRFARVPPDAPGAVSLGGRYTLSGWPTESSWDFVAVGRGHDVAFWSRFLLALCDIDPHMAVNIEHEDQELGQLEGLASAAAVLLEAARSL